MSGSDSSVAMCRCCRTKGRRIAKVLDSGRLMRCRERIRDAIVRWWKCVVSMARECIDVG